MGRRDIRLSDLFAITVVASACVLASTAMENSTATCDSPADCQKAYEVCVRTNETFDFKMVCQKFAQENEPCNYFGPRCDGTYDVYPPCEKTFFCKPLPDSESGSCVKTKIK